MLTALAAGAPLYLASAAARALEGRGGLQAAALLALAVVAVAHAALGFLAIGGPGACLPGSGRYALACALASTVITATTLAVALAAAHFFPLPVGDAVALSLAGFCGAAGVVGLAVSLRACVLARRATSARPS
jgi:hypothetical protein